MSAPAKRRTTTPRARPRPKPQPVLETGDDFEPLRFTTTDTAVEEERVTIAYLDDFEVTMPARLPANIALKIMRTSRKKGDEAAMAEMLEEVIGDEAYERLANYRGLTDDNLADLMMVVQKVAMGALEVPKASSASG